MEQEYEAEIKLLQEEIAMLQVHQENSQREVAMQHGDHIKHVLKTIASKLERGDGRTKRDAISKLTVEIKDLEEDLERQTQINGIVLTECCVKILEKSKHKTVQQHRLTGHCFHFEFQVEFQLTEIQEDDTFLRRVTDLNIVVDGSEFTDFTTFVSGVEETESLHLFFRTLRSFAERCEHRSRTFQYFKDKYPDVVSLPEGCRSEVMMIQSPKLPGCTMSIFWSIDVTKDGVITPKIDLLMKMPQQARDVDNKKVMENAPDSFQSLLRIVGVEASIESIIKTLCM